MGKCIDDIAKNEQNHSTPKYRFIETPIPKSRHIEDRWNDMKSNEITKSSIVENSSNPTKVTTEKEASKDSENCLSVEFEQTIVNGKHWETQVEESIRRIDSLSRPRTPETSPEEAHADPPKHYAARWSEERYSVSPCKQ